MVQQADYSVIGTSTAWNKDLFIRSGFTSVNSAGTYSNSYYYWGGQDTNGNYFMTDAAFEVLIENLEAGRPVGTSYPGHALVIDGYDWDNDTFHINFGWGNTSSTRWYTREEMQEQQYYNFVYDLRNDHQETFTVTDDRLYGTGTLIRAVEQANGMSGENTVVFADAVSGKSLELSQRLTVEGTFTAEQFNMDLLVTASQNGSWAFGFYGDNDSAMTFNDFNGSLICDANKTYAAAFYANSSEKCVVNADHALIYAGQYAVGGDYSAGAGQVLTSLKASQEGNSEVEDFLLDSMGSYYYSFYGSPGEDVFSLDNSSIAVGRVTLGKGDDTLSVTNHSRLYGNISPGDGTAAITVDSTSSISGDLYGSAGLNFILTGQPDGHAMFTIASAVYNVYSYATITVNMEAAELGTYTLFTAAPGASNSNYLNQLTVTVTGTGKEDLALRGNGTSASDYADLIYEDRSLKLQIKSLSDIPAKVVSVSADITALTNQNVTVTAEFNPTTTQKEYSLDGETWQTYVDGVEMSANGTVYFRAGNANGFSAVASYTVSNIDKIAPAAPAASADITAPTNGVVTVTATFSDDTAQRQYSLDGENFLAYDNGVEMQDNGTVYFLGIDEAGNASEVTSYEVSNIDKVAPEKPAASANTTMPTNQNVTVSAVFSGDSAQRQYSLDGENFLAYDNGVVMQDNGTVYFRGIDEAGNISEVTQYQVTNIDKTIPDAPTASADITTPTSQNVTVSAVFGDDLATKQYSLDNADWNSYTAGIVMEDNGTVYFRGIDEAGNISAVASYTVSNIDKIAPDAPTASADITAPTNQNVTVSAVFSDDTAQRKYSLDGENFLAYDTGVKMQDNGTVYFLGIDEAGNASEITSYEVSNIDKIAPDAPVASADITTPTNQNVTITATFSDDTAQRKYSLDGENFLAYDNGVEMQDNGTVYFLGIDEAGNASEITSYEVSNIDKIPPDKPIASADITTPTNGNVTVSATFSDDTAQKQYSLDGENFLAYDNGVEMQDNGTVYFLGIDDVGNVSEVTSYEVSNIDKIAPDKPAATASTTAPTNQNVTVTATFSDDTAQKQYSLDGENFLAYDNGVEMQDNGTVYFLGIDEAGNESEVTSYEVSNIDKAAPIITLTGNNETLTPSAALTAVTDDGSALYYSTDNTNWLPYENPLDVTENATYYFKSTDAAGNIGTNAMTFANIDPCDNVIIYSSGIAVISGVVLDDVVLPDANTSMMITSGGTASRTVLTGGKMYVSDGGVGAETTLDDGFLYVSSGGAVTDTEVNAGKLYVRSSGSAVRTALNGGVVYVSSGGVVTDTRISAGLLFVSGGGTATNTLVNGGGLQVKSGGTATVAFNPWPGKVYSSAGASVTYRERDANIYYGNDVSGVLEKSDRVENFEVASGNSLLIYSGGIAAGTLQIADGAVVSAYQGSIIDFTVAGRTAADGVLINNLSAIQGAPTYTITVAGDQAEGAYRLADGASAFTGTLVIGTDGANYGTLTVNGDALAYGDHTFSLATSDDSLMLTVAGPEPTPTPTLTTEFFTGNFAGTGTALHDVVLYRADDDGLVTVLTDTGTGFAPVELGAAGEPWKLIGVGDFNGDGVSDVLWRNMLIGDVGSWLGDGSFGVTWQHMAGASVGEWEIVGVGDFNADATDDVLWYNTETGLMLNWQVQNGVYSADAIIAGAAPGEWRFSGVGDFNGDGTDDILWHNQISGAGGYWALQNGTYSAWRDLASANPEEWTMIGIGDFDANGYDDVLWLNNDTGLVGCWANNSTGNVEWNTLAGAGDLQGWHYSGVGDFDNDGRSDVLWAHDGGAIGAWITATDRIAVGSWMPIA